MVDVIACVYKTGGDYTPEYVRRLYNGVRKYSSRPLVCLSDDPEAEQYCDEYRPLENNYPGWFSKIELFRLQSALYLDLDTIIQKNIDPICDHPHGFTMLRGFHRKRARFGSGIMAWNGDYSYILNRFRRLDMRQHKTGGDQSYIIRRLRHTPDALQDLFPKCAVSYKWGSVHDKRRAAFICYHGYPRPHETGWSVK